MVAVLPDPSARKRSFYTSLISCFLGFDMKILATNTVSLQNYLPCDEDIGGRKSEKAKELGYVILDQSIVPDIYQLILYAL